MVRTSRLFLSRQVWEERWYGGHRSGEGGEESQQPAGSMSFIDQGNETTTRSAGYCSAEMDFTSSSVSTDLWYGQHIEASSQSPATPRQRLTGAGLFWWPLREPPPVATGAGQLLLLGNGRTDKDQRRGLPKGPYNIGWPQPPPEAVVYSAAPPRCARLLGHTQDSIKSSAAAAARAGRENPSLLLKERENIRALATSTSIKYFFHHCYGGVTKRNLR